MKGQLVFSELKDLRRLRELNSLTYTSFLEKKFILANPEEEADLFPTLNHIPQTTIVIAELDKEILATVSVTIDSEYGLNSDEHFSRETNEIRKENKKLASSWRIATAKDYRKNIRIFKSLVREVYRILEENDIEHVLFIFPEENERFFSKTAECRDHRKKRN